MPVRSLADQPVIVLAIVVNTVGITEQDPVLCAASGGEVAAISTVSATLTTTGGRRRLMPRSIQTTAHRKLITPAAGQECVVQEKDLLADLAQTLGQLLTPTVVTWGGSGYDVPFLRARTFARGIFLPGMYVDCTVDCASGEVTGGHLDLPNLLFGTRSKNISLETATTLAGGWLTVGNSPAAAVETRAAMAFLILARALHARGLISADECVSAIHDGTSLIRKESLRKPHLKALLEGA